MKLFFGIIAGLIIAFLIYQSFKYILIKQPTKQKQDMASQIINRSVNAAFEKMISQGKLAKKAYDFNETLVADIWGSEVYAFEFSILVSDLKVSIEEFQTDLNSELKMYSQNHFMDIDNQITNNSVFYVTDLWQRNELVHFDIAYLTNKSTIRYVEDLKKLK